MEDQVKLTVLKGSFQGEQFTFCDRTLCTIGRGNDCTLHLPDNDTNRVISRFHCVLDIKPPQVRVRDLGSRNGTYINGVKIGQRRPGQGIAEALIMDIPAYDVYDGDVLQVGDMLIRVNLTPTPISSSDTVADQASLPVLA
jgi:pSer/pThr/pTyr-binding forkhead associated (FHA) protein